MVRIALVQMRCEKAAITDNIRVMERYVREAGRRGVDIIGFPEMSISGYANPIRYPSAAITLDGPEIDSIFKVSRGLKLTILAGLIESNPTGKPYITQAIIRYGELAGNYRKKTIKNEETDWFTSGDQAPMFKHNDLNFGVAICADIDNEEVFAEYARQGAQIVFELAAPGLYGDQEGRNWQSGFEWWERKCLNQLGSYAKKYNIWIAVATQAGKTIDEDFPGGGYVFAPDGRRVYATPDWSPGVTYLSLDLHNYQIVEE
jgi:predicted amidohydrolase